MILTLTVYIRNLYQKQIVFKLINSKNQYLGSESTAIHYKDFKYLTKKKKTKKSLWFYIMDPLFSHSPPLYKDESYPSWGLWQILLNGNRIVMEHFCSGEIYQCQNDHMKPNPVLDWGRAFKIEFHFKNSFKWSYN